MNALGEGHGLSDRNAPLQRHLTRDKAAGIIMSSSSIKNSDSAPSSPGVSWLPDFLAVCRTVVRWIKVILLEVRQARRDNMRMNITSHLHTVGTRDGACPASNNAFIPASTRPGTCTVNSAFSDMDP